MTERLLCRTLRTGGFREKPSFDMLQHMNIFKNVIINLKATGIAAIMIVIILGITALGLFGRGELASTALTSLCVLAGLIGVAISSSHGSS